MWKKVIITLYEAAIFSIFKGEATEELKCENEQNLIMENKFPLPYSLDC